MQYSYELFVKELGAKLKQMRKDRGWTQRDMVIDHRLHLTQWQRLEKGKGVATPSLLRICEIFDIGLSELVGDLGQVGHDVEATVPVSNKAKDSGNASAKGTKTAPPPRAQAKTSPA